MNLKTKQTRLAIAIGIVLISIILFSVYVSPEVNTNCINKL